VGEDQSPTGGSRLYFLDNLRSFLIFLVIVIHAGIVYESSGFGEALWLVHDPATNDTSGLFNLIIDMFVMFVLFFISGYLAPGSANRKTNGAFILAKLKRLLIPWVIAVFTLIPIYNYLFLHTRGLPLDNWRAYFHFLEGTTNQNWLWFLPVLFAFELIFLLMHRLDWIPTKLPVKAAIALVTILGFAYGYQMVVFGGNGWTKTFLFDFQNERLFIYFLFFLLGTVCYHQNVFAKKPKKTLFIVLSATAWIPMDVYIFAIIHQFLHPGEYIFSFYVDHAIIQFSLLITVLVMLYLLIAMFWFWFDKEGPIRRELNRNSYGVYIIHMVVIGGIALLLINVAVPSLLKHLILVVAAWVVSNLIMSGYMRIKRLVTA
jgi:Acyltransferase family